MTGGDDAKAAEAARLHALQQRAEERRRELGETLAALTERVSEHTDLRAWARREGRHAAGAVGHAAMGVARRVLLTPAPDGVAPEPMRHVPASNRARTVMSVAVPSAVLAMAAWWWWHSTRRPHGRRPSATRW